MVQQIIKLQDIQNVNIIKNIESSAEVTLVNLISQTTNPLLIHARETLASNSQISLAPVFEINV